MQENGNIRSQILALLFVISMLAGPRLWGQESYEYYVCSYAEPSWGSSQIRVTALHLNSRDQVWTTVVDLPGELESKKPIKLTSGQHDLWFVSTHYGLPSKNSPTLGIVSTHYAVLDNEGSILRTGEIADIFLRSFKPYRPDSVRIDFIEGSGPDSRQFKGTLSLNRQRTPIIANTRGYSIPPRDLPPIAGFDYYQPISMANNTHFWSVQPEGTYILDVNLADSVLADSLNIESDVSYFYLFGLSHDDSLVYVFYMNYNRLVGPEWMQKLNIDSSYVKIFDALSFALLDSIPIPYPPLDSGYVGGTTGVCDPIGPYLVYFDMSSDGMEYFSPAMLFIFDTRTNEASWLRVGWR
jgi:hypothetical protein